MTQALLSVFVLHWLVLVTPGVNYVLLASLAARGSRRAALWAAVGISTATLVWATLAVAGVDAVFRHHPLLRRGVQVVAAAYLLYAAVRMLRASAGAATVLDVGAERRTADAGGIADGAAYRMGLATNLGNPKPIFFFGSLFVSLLPPTVSTGMLVACVVIAVANALTWHLVLALALSNSRMRGLQARHARRIGQMGALAMALLALFMLGQVVLELL